MFGPFWIMIVAITAIVVGSWALVRIAKMVASYLEGRSGEASLTTKELADVIGAAVAEAVRPLEEKIDGLEQRLLTRRSDAPADDEEGSPL